MNGFQQNNLNDSFGVLKYDEDYEVISRNLVRNSVSKDTHYYVKHSGEDSIRSTEVCDNIEDPLDVTNSENNEVTIEYENILNNRCSMLEQKNNSCSGDDEIRSTDICDNMEDPLDVPNSENKEVPIEYESIFNNGHLISEQKNDSGNILCSKSGTKTKNGIKIMQPNNYLNEPYTCKLCVCQSVSKINTEEPKLIAIDEKLNINEKNSYKNANNQMSVPSTEKPYKSKYIAFERLFKNGRKKLQRKHFDDKSFRKVGNHFICEVCSFQTDGKKKIKYHMRIHFEGERYLCEICSYETTSKQSFNVHIKAHTAPKEQFSCELCSHKFVRKTSLMNHINGYHKGELRYYCDLCSYKCYEKAYLNRHMLSHTGEKPHSCPICSYKSARKCRLNTHMLTHTGEKKFYCEECSSEFAMKSQLKIHILTHNSAAAAKLIKEEVIGEKI